MTRARAAVSAGFGLQGFVFAAVVTQTPRLQDRFGLHEGDVTVILVIVAAVSGVGSFLAGSLADRRGSAAAFAAALTGIGIGAALVGLAPVTGLLLVAFGVYGLAIGAVDATMNMQGVRVQALAGRSLMAGFHGAWSVGGIVGSGFAALAGRLDVPVTTSLVVVAVIVLAVTAATRHDHVQGDVLPDVAAPTASAAVVPWRPVLVFGLVICLAYAADTGTLTWSSVYLDDVLDAGAGIVPLGYAAYQVGAIISRLCGDAVVRRVGAAPVVAGGAALATVGLAGVLLAPTALVAVAAFGVVGLGLAVLAPLSFAAVAAAVPPPAVDGAIARMNIANYAGAILGGGLIGAVAGAGALRWAFVVPLVLVPPVLLLARAFRAPGQVSRSRRLPHRGTRPREPWA